VARLHRQGLRYVKDEQAVEEIVSDIFLDIWLRRHEIVLEGELSAYLFRAMHNKSISYLRTRKIEVIEMSEIPEDSFSVGNTVDQMIALKETSNMLEQELSRLSPQRQKVFRLSREQDMSYTEIAATLNISPNTVKNHISAALEQLREGLKKDIVSTTILLVLYIFF
jgi:RNA polymerase sigma-70 factor (ECF subfamily)